MTVGRVGRRATGRAADFLSSALKGFVMKSIRLLVRDAARAIQGSVAPPWAGAIVGALAADPETIAELDTAMQRFQVDAPPEAWRESFVDSDEELDPDAWGAVVDLPTRLIFWSGGPGPEEGASSAPVLDKGELTSAELPYEWLPAWQIVRTRDGWRERVEAARQTQLEHAPLDMRAVLYDRLLEWLADALCGGQYNNSDDPVVSIHAAWLATPRDDLAGQTPRDVLIAQQQWIEQDLQWRRSEWSRLGRPPAGVPRESRAYRHAGIGLHEFIMYYDLVRHLLGKAWEEQPADFANRDTLLGWLRHEQSRWLLNSVHDGTPDAFVPGEVIDLERQRIPLTADAESQMIDCDCPLCQMMAEESFGPTFIHFDTVHFDMEFVFSPYRTRKEWEFDYGPEGERTGAEDADETDESDLPDEDVVRTVQVSGPLPGGAGTRESGPALRVGLPFRANLVEMMTGSAEAPVVGAFEPSEMESLMRQAPTDRLWMNSRIATPPASASRSQRLQSYLFEVAAHSVELRDDVKSSAEHTRMVERLIEDFANLRAAMRQQDFARVGRLTEECVDLLNAIGVARQEVAVKCADLEKSFRRLEKTICERTDEETSEADQRKRPPKKK